MLLGTQTQPVTLYDSGGAEIHPVPSASFMAPINIRQTATTAAQSTVWYLNAAGALGLYIRRLVLQVGFDGTAAASTVRYDLLRYGTAVCSGGIAITPIKKSTANATATTATAGFADTGVTVTSVVFETAFATLACPISVTSRSSVYPINLVTPAQRFGEIVIASGQGLAIQLTVTAVVGQTITGYVEWDEK